MPPGRGLGLSVRRRRRRRTLRQQGFTRKRPLIMLPALLGIRLRCMLSRRRRPKLVKHEHRLDTVRWARRGVFSGRRSRASAAGMARARIIAAHVRVTDSQALQVSQSSRVQRQCSAHLNSSNHMPNMALHNPKEGRGHRAPPSSCYQVSIARNQRSHGISRSLLQ